MKSCSFCKMPQSADLNSDNALLILEGTGARASKAFTVMWLSRSLWRPFLLTLCSAARLVRLTGSPPECFVSVALDRCQATAKVRKPSSEFVGAVKFWVQVAVKSWVCLPPAT